MIPAHYSSWTHSSSPISYHRTPPSYFLYQFPLPITASIASAYIIVIAINNSYWEMNTPDKSVSVGIFLNAQFVIVSSISHYSAR